MIDLDAQIKEVTVYADRALVIRRGSLHLEAGEHELRVNNLPQFSRDSLRTAGQGSQGTRIINVDVTTAFYSRPPESELRALQLELEQVQQQEQLLRARQDSLNDRRKWLRALGEQSKDFAKGLAQGQMKPQDCADFFSFMTSQALQDAEAAQHLDGELQQAQQEVAAKKRELAQQQGHHLPDRQAAIVSIALATSGDFELELSYLVEGASWYPQYDVRAQINDEKSKGEVDLTYVGMVQQTTGERWENVQLALSTARPSLAAVLPELDPWYLSVVLPPPPMQLAMAAPAVSGAKMMRSAASYGASRDSLDMALEAPAYIASVDTATVEHTGTALVFRVGRSVDIPSDNSPHKTTIARDNLPCVFDYVSAPIIEEHTHLRAAITNTTERVLLDGSASIFLGGEYVGTTRIKETAPTEKFKVFLGIDDDIKVKRELIERSVDKGSILQSDIRRITYAYRITVHNYASSPRHIAIRDHLPVPQHERIKIKVQQIQPQPSNRSKLELLTWSFTLPADGEQQIEYRFIVEHPQDMQVRGLPDQALL
ncbi:MAG TPA: mucoidy inhibitor MuiA family protein [Ktedonosporobacter sp.]|nr:mucoidy inhibitor MuiA family protein [Ktedonosporobacter sp.]